MARLVRILSSDQRAFIRIQTGIDQLVLDRCCDAYERLVNHDDVEGYKENMGKALVQLGFPGVVPPDSERPTALDKAKTFCIRSIADQKGWTYKRTAKWIFDAVKVPE